MDSVSAQAFASGLRELSMPRVRLDQVVKVFHHAFPSETMRPDMRGLVHDAIEHLCRDGAITVPHGQCGGVCDDCPRDLLPGVIELSESTKAWA